MSTVYVTLDPTMHRPEIALAKAEAHGEGHWMFWNAVRIEDPERADAFEEKLKLYRELDGYHYTRLADGVFHLPPIYRLKGAS